MIITNSTTIEDLVEKVPKAIFYLSKKGIKCVMCGEPIWGTLEEVAKEKGFNENEINQFVGDLNELSKSG